MEQLPASRRAFLKAGGAVALAAGGMQPAFAAADPSRIALVVGNNAYTDVRGLRNAVNDAIAVRDLLMRADFSVTYKADLEQAPFRDAVAAFGAAASRPEVKQALFYYAGHGAQLDWRNFLLPVDIRITSAAELPSQGVELGTLLGYFSRAKGKVFVLVLDACRNDPFGTALRLPQSGLSQFDAPPGTLIAFSTSPGAVANDGEGANGLYTQNLVRELSVKTARVEEALKRVRLAVRVASRGEQVPWESTSLESEVFLFPSATSKLTEAELEAEFQRELTLWNRIKGSKRAEDWIAYLQGYPGGKFTEIAQNRLNSLLAEEERAKAQVLAAALPPSVPAAVASAPAATPAPAPIARQPDLVIGPGLPVPVLIRASQNPASAGTYPAEKRFSVGDEVVYQQKDLFGVRQADLAFRVSLTNDDADVVEVNGGERLWDTMGNLVKGPRGSYSPPLQLSPVDYQIGRKWTTRFRLSGSNYVSVAYYDCRIVAREIVRVPAGEFDAFKIEAVGFSDLGWRFTLVQWQVPRFNFYVKLENTTKPVNAAIREGMTHELLSCKQMRWSVA